jgi:hypothetical protein
VAFEIQGFKEPMEINGFFSFAPFGEHFDIMQKSTMRLSVQTVIMGSYNKNWWFFKTFVAAEKGALALYMLSIGGIEAGPWVGVGVLGVGTLMTATARPYIDADEWRVDLILRAGNFCVMFLGALIGSGKIDPSRSWAAPMLFSASVTAMCTMIFAVGPRRLVGIFWQCVLFVPVVFYAFVGEAGEGGGGEGGGEGGGGGEAEEGRGGSKGSSATAKTSSGSSV